eukprot:6029822-Pleurochrysis_carterae.AAC.1
MEARDAVRPMLICSTAEYSHAVARLPAKLKGIKYYKLRRLVSSAHSLARPLTRTPTHSHAR